MSYWDRLWLVFVMVTVVIAADAIYEGVLEREYATGIVMAAIAAGLFALTRVVRWLEFRGGRPGKPGNRNIPPTIPRL